MLKREEKIIDEFLTKMVNSNNKRLIPATKKLSNKFGENASIVVVPMFEILQNWKEMKEALKKGNKNGK